MKALVTGASGFIGSTLIDELNSAGFEVFALLRKTSDVSNLNGIKYQRLEGDLSHFESLKKAVQGMDYVFHLAGVTAAPNREGYFRHNAEGTRCLAQAVTESAPRLKRFVFVSSLAAGGPATSLDPRIETQEDRPVSAYGESKLQAERELLQFKDKYPISIVRPPMVYGPKDKGVFVAVQTVAKNMMPLLQGSTPDRNKYYSLIHSRDLCRGIIQAAMVPVETVPSGEVFYLTGDRIHTYREMLTVIAGHLELKKPWTFPVPKFALTIGAFAGSAAGNFSRKTFPLNLDKLNEILPDYWICSNQKAKTLLGFEPRHDLTTGMQDAILWYKQNKWI